MCQIVVVDFDVCGIEVDDMFYDGYMLFLIDGLCNFVFELMVEDGVVQFREGMDLFFYVLMFFVMVFCYFNVDLMFEEQSVYCVI